MDKRIYIIAILGTILAVFWQELNLYFLNGNFPESHGLITCADEASFIRPPENLLLKGVWKDNSNGITSYFTRPPGYGIYFLCLKLLLGKYVWWGMKFFQVSFYFFTIILVSKSLQLLNLKNKLIIISTSVFAFLPCFSGFMYFTISESISPFFMLLSTYYWLKITKNQEEKPFKFILSISFLILLRPHLLLFVLLFTIYFLFQKRKKIFFFSLLAFLPYILWNIRSISLAKEWVGWNPIYSYTNNGIYRPNQKQMTNLFRIWEHQADVFHTALGTLANDTSSIAIQKSLQSIPKKYRKDVFPIFKEYHDLKKYQYIHFPDTTKIKGPYKGELEFDQKLDKKIQQLKSKNKLDYYIITPFKSLKKLLISSHLNLRIFQVDFRGNILMEILRWACVLMIMAIFSISSLNVLQFKFNNVFFISLGILGFLFYFSFFHRMNEERYLTPIIPIAFIILVRVIFKTKNDENI